MTATEYKQFKAFARVDGAVLGVIISVTYMFFVLMMTNLQYQWLYLIGLVSVPVFVSKRVQNYRDNIVQKRVSFNRALAYSASCFGYAALVVAIVTLVYLQFFDHGMFVQNLLKLFSMPEMKQTMVLSGMNPADLEHELGLLSELRPIDFAVNMITNVFFSGLILSIIIAMFCRRMPKQAAA